MIHQSETPVEALPNRKKSSVEDRLLRIFDSKVLTAVLAVFLCVWYIPFVSRGIEYMDTGFSLTNYKTFFENGDISDIGLFFTNVIGALFYRALPGGQLVVFRFLYLVLGLLTALLSYLCFKRQLHRNLILSVLILLAMFTKSGEAILSYYPLTSLILTGSLLLLLNGLESRKKGQLFLSGLLSGFNIFFRLPNAAFGIVVVGIIFYDVVSKRGWKTTLQDCVLFLGGMLTGTGISLIIIGMTFGFSGIADALMHYAGSFLGTTAATENTIGVSEANNHSLGAVLSLILSQLVLAGTMTVKYLLPVTVILALLVFAAKKLIKNKNAQAVAVFISVPLIALAAAAVLYGRTESTVGLALYLLSLLISLAALILLRKESPRIRVMFLLNILLGAVCVFGSDMGIHRVAIFCRYSVLCLCLAVKCFWQRAAASETHTGAKRVGSALLNCFTMILLFVVLAVSLLLRIPSTFRDASYSSLDFEVNEEISALNGMKTSEIRRDEINEYYELMNADELQDKEVAIFGYFPLGYVIGPQTDYFVSVQPCVDYPAVSVESLLEVIEEKSAEGNYPVIVISYVNQLQTNSATYTSEAKQAVIDYMLTQTEYETYSSDEFFTVYVPVSD